MVLVERPLVVVHRVVVRPRLGNHHHDRVRQGAAREVEQFERVVEHARVAAIGIDDRADLADVLAEGCRLEVGLARMHPVRVAADRVDLAVVGDVAVWMRTVPAGERIGAEARVDQRQRGLHQRVVQVLEILVELRRQQHALEHDRARREADDVPVLGPRQRGGADLVVGTLADHIQLALEREVVIDIGIALDEDLPHEGFARARRLAEHAVRGRYGAPAEHGLAFGLHDLFELLFDLAPDGRVARQEDDAAAVLAGGGQLDASLAADLLIERVGHLQQDACAIARIHFAAAGAAVVEVLQYLDCLLEDPVRLVALDVDDETDPASIVLVARIVEALFPRRPERHGWVLDHPGRPYPGARKTLALGSCWALPGYGWRRQAQAKPRARERTG